MKERRPEKAESGAIYAITSAELKLLRLRLTFLSPGRSDLDPGLTTAAAFVFIHASDVGAVVPFLRVALVATSLSDDVWCGLRSVGNRDGIGEGGGLGRRDCAGATGCLTSAVVLAVVGAADFPVVASLGILLGL